ncbi:cation transport ATPase [Arthrobacter oryzae]|nr:cation transport ATPase [Arthrobacter oryzae]
MLNEQILHQPESRVIELDIEGMTCSSCVGRVERKLGKIDGVEALVNLPLESAQVTVPANVTDEQITATVAAVGYKATVRRAAYPVGTIGTMPDPAPAGPAGSIPAPPADGPPSHPAGKLRPRLIVAAILTVPVFLVSMVPALQFPNWVGWWACWPCRW